MTPRRRRYQTAPVATGGVISAVTSLALIVGLVGCAAAPLTRTVNIDSFLGRPFDELKSQVWVWPHRTGLPHDFGLITYNVTDPVTGAAGREAPGLLDSDGFRIVALCWTEPLQQLDVAVVDEEDMSPAVEERARARGYDGLLRMCPGTGRDFTVAAPPDADSTITADPPPN